MRLNRHQPLLSLLTYVTAAALLAANGDVGLPGRHSLQPLLAFAVGLVVAIFLFAALARGRYPRLGTLRTRASTFARLGTYVVLKATAEEVVWRGAVLSAVAAVAGVAAGWAFATVVFAAVHLPTQGRRGLVHLVTGGVFGAVYIRTGSLAAAAAAHAGYNLLAMASRLRPRAAVVRTTPERMATASLEGVRRRFDSFEALRGIDLSIEPGEVVALLGPNGAGKSTAIEILLGLRGADSGTAAIFGESPRLARTRTRVGVALQQSAFPALARVGELVDFVRAHYPSPLDTDEVLRWFQLDELRDRYTSKLSGGERRRLVVALAFVGGPRFVVLDEPTTGLDLESRLAVWAAIREFAAAGGSVLLTTHQLEETEALATRIVVLSQGLVVAEGSVEEIRRHAGLMRVRLEQCGALPDVPGIERTSVDGAVRTLYTADAGSVVTALVRRGVRLDGLEVLPASLEEALLKVAELAS